jgi:hypothetical protein
LFYPFSCLFYAEIRCCFVIGTKGRSVFRKRYKDFFEL